MSSQCTTTLSFARRALARRLAQTPATVDGMNFQTTTGELERRLAAAAPDIANAPHRRENGAQDPRSSVTVYRRRVTTQDVVIAGRKDHRAH